MEEYINAYINEYIYSNYRKKFPINEGVEWIPLELWEAIIFLGMPEEKIKENVFEEIEHILMKEFVEGHPDDPKQVHINGYWPVDYQGEIQVLYINTLYAYMNVLRGKDRICLLQSMIIYPLLGKIIKIKCLKKSYEKTKLMIQTFFQKYFAMDFKVEDIALLKDKMELVRKYRLHEEQWKVVEVIQEMTNYCKLVEAKVNYREMSDEI